MNPYQLVFSIEKEFFYNVRLDTIERFVRPHNTYWDGRILRAISEIHADHEVLAVFLNSGKQFKKIIDDIQGPFEHPWNFFGTTPGERVGWGKFRDGPCWGIWLKRPPSAQGIYRWVI